MDTVVVIGSNSFSGSDFVELLLGERSYRIVGVSRSPEKSRLFLPYLDRDDLSRFCFRQLDVNRDAGELESFLGELKPRYVVNFASQSEVAPSWEHPEQWFRTNAESVARLGNFLRKQEWLERYVHISTPEVYGTCEGSVSEDAPFRPSTPYAASRAAGELMLATLVKSFGFPCALVRSSNVYGAHQQLFKIIPRTLIYLRTGRVLQLHGGGSQVRSFIHIRDVSRGELAVMESAVPPGTAFNLSPDGGVPLRDVVERLCRLSGSELAGFVEDTPARVGNDAAYVLDSTRAATTLGWAPRVSLEAGLREVADWVNREWGAIASEPLEYIHQQ